MEEECACWENTVLLSSGNSGDNTLSQADANRRVDKLQDDLYRRVEGSKKNARLRGSMSC